MTARVAPAGDRTSLGVTITTAIDLRVPHLDQGHAERAQNAAGWWPGPESPPCSLVAATQDQAGRLALTTSPVNEVNTDALPSLTA